ncbi:Atc1 protein [Bdellovibrio bacteriovorus W]|nr:Atc1 protein [Bdellovibrio bacteriovorus W]
MQQDIPKMCADSLRTFTSEKLNIKLKAAHAHELFAAYVGYSSKNAMLADTKYPINSLPQAKIVIMVPDADVDRRRTDLEGLSPDLPNSYLLGEPIYASLFSDKFWASHYPPFRSFEKAAIYLAERDYNFQEVFKRYHGIPLHHFVSVRREQDAVTLSVIHATRTSNGEMLGNGKTKIELHRVAGHIGYEEPRISVERWSGGARRTLEPFEGGYTLASE